MPAAVDQPATTGMAASGGVTAARPLVAPPPTSHRAGLLLVLVILLWGINWPIIRLGLAVIPPLWFAAARLALGAACLWLIQVFGSGIVAPTRQDLPIIFSVGLLQFGAFLGLTHVAVQFVPPGRSAILAYTTPFWVVPLARFVLKERLTPSHRRALIFGAAGLAVLFNPLAVDYGNGQVLLGNGLLLLAAMAWAFAIVHVRAHRWRVPPSALIPWQMSLAAVAVGVVASLLEPTPEIAWNARLLAVLAYNGPIASALCFWAFITINRALPAATTALASLGVPVVGVIAAAIVVGEPITLSNLVGLGLIVVGTACLIRGGLGG
jgi:drug/metabolite transporter (DMT)-like permease